MKKTILMAALLSSLLLFSLNFSGSTQNKETNPVVGMIARLEVGKPVSHGSLTIVPVYLSRIKDKTAYVTMEEAFSSGWLEITEVEGGRVPQVKISNNSKYPVYLMGGEILSGCKQDRLLAGDVLLSPFTKNLLVPVYCVEQGRWTHTSSSFYSKKILGTPKLRAMAQEKAPAAQSGIWSTISSENRKMGVRSATSAYQDAYKSGDIEEKIGSIEQRMKGIPRLDEDAVGVVIGLGGRVVSTDIFVNPLLFRKQWPKILKSSALTSLGSSGKGHLGQKDAAAFLRSFKEKTFRVKKGLDLGDEFTSVDDTLNFFALVYKDVPLHMAGFPQDQDRIKVGDSPEQRIRVIREEIPPVVIRDRSED